MAKLTGIDFGYGSVEFHAGIDEVPPSSETTGNVTINNMGLPGSPAYFTVNHMLTCDLETSGTNYFNMFSWKTIVADQPQGALYRDIEAEAARQLAPMLRDVADAIEKQVAEYDQRLTEHKA